MPFAVVSLKAFGDLVIARAALRQTPPQAGAGLVLGSHLQPLDRALGDHAPYWTLPVPDHRVPAAFDARRRGPRAALASLYGLRRAMKALILPADAVLLFDRLGPRERAIAAGRPAQALPAAANIYLAYQQILPQAGPTPPPRHAEASSIVGLFPSSRLPVKNLPLEVIRALGAAAQAAGLDCRVHLLEGERPDLEAAMPEAVVLPRRFEAVIEAIQGMDAVISSDSLPAHLAAYVDRPVFIVGPAPNAYWLPLSAFTAGRFALFGEVLNGSPALRAFLAEPA